MEFGWVDDIRNIDFRLREEPKENSWVWPQFPENGSMKLHPGLTGWGEPGWIGSLYPQKLKRTDFLKVYSRILPSVELNSTFYGIPSPDVAAKWAETVPPGFAFIPKIPRTISQHPQLKPDSRSIQEYYAFLDTMGSTAPATFLQLPPGFTTDRHVYLEQMIDAWEHPCRLFIEFRHRSWLAQTDLLERCRKRDVGLVITDVAGHRELAHMQLTTPSVVVRFVACNDSEIDQKRLLNWAERLQYWSEKGMKAAWFFLHKRDNVAAPGLARTFHEIVSHQQPALTMHWPKIPHYGIATHFG